VVAAVSDTAKCSPDYIQVPIQMTD